MRLSDVQDMSHSALMTAMVERFGLDSGAHWRLEEEVARLPIADLRRLAFCLLFAPGPRFIGPSEAKALGSLADLATRLLLRGQQAADARRRGPDSIDLCIAQEDDSTCPCQRCAHEADREARAEGRQLAADLEEAGRVARRLALRASELGRRARAARAKGDAAMAREHAAALARLVAMADGALRAVGV